MFAGLVVCTVAVAVTQLLGLKPSVERLTSHLTLSMRCPPIAGEDYPCGGRLLLFEIVRSGAGGSEGLHSWTGRLIYTRCVPHGCTAYAYQPWCCALAVAISSI